MSGNNVETWNAAIAKVRVEYDADIYFYSAEIGNAGFGSLSQQVTEHKLRDNALVILVTNGGLANSAYQIARFMQGQYKKFSLFCPSRCKSAGTLVALGANELIMDTFSELGPLDVQLFKQNEIASRKSGLLARSSFDALADSAFELYERLMVNITVRSGGTVSFKLASELSASMASTMMQPVYAQINPETVGSENRDLSIAFEYGCRLADHSGNATPPAIYQLVHGYPSHDFIIDFDEARTLFATVNYPSEGLYELIGLIGDAAYAEASPGFVGVLDVIEVKAGHDGQQEDSDNAESAPEASLDESGRPDQQSDPEPERREPSEPNDQQAEPANEVADPNTDSPLPRALRLLEKDA